VKSTIHKLKLLFTAAPFSSQCHRQSACQEAYISNEWCSACGHVGQYQERIHGGEIASPKTYESNFIYHYFLQFGKEHSRYKAILSAIFCHSSVVMYTSPSYSSEAIMRLANIAEIAQPNLIGWIRPWTIQAWSFAEY